MKINEKSIVHVTTGGFHIEVVREKTLGFK